MNPEVWLLVVNVPPEPILHACNWLPVTVEARLRRPLTFTIPLRPVKSPVMTVKLPPVKVKPEEPVIFAEIVSIPPKLFTIVGAVPLKLRMEVVLFAPARV